MGIIQGTETFPDANQNVAVRDYNLPHALAKSQIVRCIESEMKMKIMDQTSAHRMWTTLKSYHNGNSANDKERRRAELHGLRLHDFRNMASFLDAVLQKKRADQRERNSGR